MLIRLALACGAVLGVVGGLLLATGGAPRAGGGLAAAQAEVAALRWVGTGVAEAARRDDDAWEVDVLRPDGSLVEVTLGDEEELLGLDEEVGPNGAASPDELSGPRRARAAGAALSSVGPGVVLGVERDPEGELEVDVRRADGVALELGLDRRLRVTEVHREDLGDE
jgi:hypothetical protein